MALLFFQIPHSISFNFLLNHFHFIIGIWIIPLEKWDRERLTHSSNRSVQWHHRPDVRRGFFFLRTAIDIEVKKGILFLIKTSVNTTTICHKDSFSISPLMKNIRKRASSLSSRQDQTKQVSYREKCCGEWCNSREPDPCRTGEYSNHGDDKKRIAQNQVVVCACEYKREGEKKQMSSDSDVHSSENSETSPYADVFSTSKKLFLWFLYWTTRSKRANCLTNEDPD